MITDINGSEFIKTRWKRGATYHADFESEQLIKNVKAKRKEKKRKMEEKIEIIFKCRYFC